MPRYYMHVRQGETLCQALEGAVFPDLEEARAEAVCSARELAPQRLRTTNLSGGICRLRSEWTNTRNRPPTRATLHNYHGENAFRKHADGDIPCTDQFLDGLWWHARKFPRASFGDLRGRHHCSEFVAVFHRLVTEVLRKPESVANEPKRPFGAPLILMSLAAPIDYPASVSV
jgi:hypothetical protein